MIPVLLDPARVRIALVGNGARAARRLAQLDEAGARHLVVYAESPGPGLAAAAGDRLVHGLPDESELRRVHVVYIAELAPGQAEALAETARRLGTLVNAEDVKPLCDFHVPAQVRRGELVIAIGTGGASPGLAQRLRRYLEGRFGPEWAGWLDELAHARQRWRESGADAGDVTRRTNDMIDQRGWLR